MVADWCGEPRGGGTLRRVDDARARELFATHPVARLATVRPDGSPHLVPVTFAMDGDVVYTAVDAKPKRTQHLQRIVNLRHDARCTLLVDHYDDDWSQLWWVRVDGHADVRDVRAAADPGLAALARKYPQYANAPPRGPMIAIRITGWNVWTAT